MTDYDVKLQNMTDYDVKLQANKGEWFVLSLMKVKLLPVLPRFKRTAIISGRLGETLPQCWERRTATYSAAILGDATCRPIYDPHVFFFAPIELLNLHTRHWHALTCSSSRAHRWRLYGNACPSDFLSCSFMNFHYSWLLQELL